MVDFWPCPKEGYAESPTPFTSGHIYMKDAHSAESNEKLCIRFFRFLFFELYFISYSKIIEK